MIPIPAGKAQVAADPFELRIRRPFQEARMVLKAFKVSLSLVAAATSMLSLFAVGWIGLALLGY
jgi:hypothetical protein